MRFDVILESVGELGPYQKRIFVLLCLPIVFVALFDVNNTFLLYTPEHRCQDAKEENSTFPNQNSTGTSEPLIKCFIRKTNPSGKGNDSMVEHCTSWKYDQSVFTSTFVSELDLVCNNSLVPTYSQMVAYGGASLGALIQGVLSDRLGRKIIINISLVLAAAAGLVSAWSPNIYVFTALRFVNIFATRGIYINSFILAVELVGSSKREFVGFFFFYFYSSGIVLLAGIGFVLRQWDYIQIACSAPMLFFFIYFWILPESPRWLICRGRMTEATAIIMKLAVANNTESYSPSNDVDNKHKNDHYSSRTLVWQSLILFMNYLAVFHCYYGLTLNTENLNGDFYLNFLLNGLVELLAITVAVLSSRRLKRKHLFISGMSLGGSSLICSAATFVFTDKDVITTITLTMVGKTGIYHFNVRTILWSAELIPTTIRSSVLGISIACGNAGSVVSPYIADLSKGFPETVGPAVPLFVFGSFSLISALLTILLPETQNKKLPETVAQAQEMTRH